MTGSIGKRNSAARCRLAGVAGALIVCSGCVSVPPQPASPVVSASSAVTVAPASGKGGAAAAADAGILADQEAFALALRLQGGAFELDPELSRYVAGIAARLAAVRDPPRRPVAVTLINSSAPLSWSAGAGERLAVSRGLLLALDSEAELAGVLAHQLAHGTQEPAGPTAAADADKAVGLPASARDFSALAVGEAALAAAAVGRSYSPQQELAADALAMVLLARAGYDPRAYVQWLQRSLALAPSAMAWRRFFQHHPARQARRQAAQERLSELPAGGRLGNEDFAAATAQIRAWQPAYVLFDVAAGALHGGELEAALSAIDRAIALVPDEARFFALKAEVFAARVEYERARALWDVALARREDDFAVYLRRGQLFFHQGAMTRALADLQRSVELLPTAPAHYTLGLLAQREQRLGDAKVHFRVAGRSRSPLGKQAREALARIELPENPARYVIMRAGHDEQGRIHVQIVNRAALPVTNVAAQVRLIDEDGQAVDYQSLFIDEILLPQQPVTARTYLRLNDDAQKPLSVTVKVYTAEIAE